MSGLRVGLVGAGLMGQEHARNLLSIDGASVTAVADPDPGSRRAAGALLAEAAPALFPDHRALLDSGACDAVVVATPNMTHAAVALDVVAAGLPLLVEKPLCTTVADCRRLAEAAAAAGTLVWVGLEYRYLPPVRALLQEVAAGTAGLVRMVAIREHRYPFLPKVGDWNRFNRNTGGTLVEKCCHFFDLMRLATGAEPVAVMASGAQDHNHLDERYDGEQPDVLDNAYVIVDFDDGSRGMLDLCMFADATRFEQEVAVVGTGGKLEALLPDGGLRVGRRGTHWIGAVEERPVAGDAPYQGLHHGASWWQDAAWVAAVDDGGPPAVGIADGLVSVAVGVAAQRSIAEARRVLVAEILDEA